MTPKHTPSPFTFCWGDARRIVNLEARGKANDLFPVASLRGPDREANARLFIAAPEMLELLRNVVKQHENLNPYERLPDSLIREIEIVIDKATGCLCTVPDPADDV